jgi:hypothetical protein
VAGAADGEPGLGVSGAAPAFARLKTLAGEWQGSVQWTGARTDSGTMSARYSIIGNGTAVVEDLISDGTVAMSSVYHLDGDALRLTHYCGAGNQPRLKASRVDAQAGLLRFSFVDITNLRAPDVGHVNAVELRVHDAQHLTLVFTFVVGGRESYERIELTRSANAEGPRTRHR